MKSAFLASVALAISTVTLVACKETPPADAVPEGMPGVTVSNARLILPAVKGNPGVVYFDIAYDGSDYAVLRKVEVAGAKSSSLHDNVLENGQTRMFEIPPLNLKKGEPVKFEPGGKHVMVMGLDPALQAGGTAEITLTFAGGDKLSTDAKIEAAGGAKN